MTTQIEDHRRPFLAWPALRWPDGLRLSPLVLVLIGILLIAVVPPGLFLLNASVHETLPDGSRR